METPIEVKQTNKLLNFADFVNHSKVFIETGTCYGRSVEQALKDGYETVLSVEAKEDLFNHCEEKFRSNQNVLLWKGESTKRLPIMLEELDRIQQTSSNRAVFWLDAHPSGELSAGHADLMQKGVESEFHQHNILKKELAIVLVHRNDHIIMIDDQNGANPDNHEYVRMMYNANPNYKFYWYDEQMGENFYKDKVLIAIPE